MMTKDTSGKTYDDKVVSMSDDQLKTTCSEGNEHCYTVSKDAKVTCDGQPGNASDLQAGMSVRVTTHKDDKTVATALECGKCSPA